MGQKTNICKYMSILFSIFLGKSINVFDIQNSSTKLFIENYDMLGTQAFVHFKCLRKWQSAVMSSRRPSANYGPALMYGIF